MDFTKNELLSMMRQVEEAQEHFRKVMMPDLGRVLKIHDQVEEARRQVREVMMPDLSALVAVPNQVAAAIGSNQLLAQIQPTLDLHNTALEQIQPFVETVERLTDASGPLFEAQKLAIESMRPIWEANERIVSQLAPIAEMNTRIGEAFASLNKTVFPFLDDLAPILRELPKRQRAALETLAKHGWYFDLEMTLPTLWQLEELFEDSTTVEQGDALLVAHYEKRLDAIEAELVEQFPSRATLFKQGFSAHRAGSYALTVPFFLVQAEGICVDFTGVKLFSRQRGNGKPALAAHFDDLKDGSVSDAMLHPLTIPSPLSASDKELGEDADSLNRHTVLHGKCVTYDKQINSCQAISILYFVARVLKKEAAVAKD